tara:strand:- start:1217 stop:2155 length:939 start_codon:yes stop_codon:yes gene_type:complete
MSNILIIKHGSLGDIVQISGVLRDIRANHKESKIFLLTTSPYIELLSTCPYIDGVLIDKRSPRWNIFYLAKLKKMLSKYNFSNVYDLQNSSRTSFYRKFLLRIPNWSSTETSLKNNQSKKIFDQDSVLERFKFQLEQSNMKTQYTLTPDFSWASVNVDKIVNKYFGKNFILIFPFCSPQLSHKKWPYFNSLIKIIKLNHSNLEIALAPANNEIEEAKTISATTIINDDKPLNIMQLAGLIKKASYIIANDTGPAHMAAHLDKNGIVLFGYHTTAKKVSIETEKFKALSVNDLSKLSAEDVYSAIKDKLNLVN